MPSGSPDAPTSGPSGPAPFPVSRFRALDSDVAMRIEDTCGPLFSGSSPSAGLRRSLESRLRATLDVNGSPEYALTWSMWDMPAGPPICRLRASAHRTSGNGSGGWPTPNVPNGGRSIAHAEMRGSTAYHKGKKVQVGLEAVAQMAGWATPTTGDSKDRASHGAGNLALPGQASTSRAADATTTSYDHTRDAIASGTRYRYQIRAVNEAGEGPMSGSVDYVAP